MLPRLLIICFLLSACVYHAVEKYRGDDNSLYKFDGVLMSVKTDPFWIFPFGPEKIALNAYENNVNSICKNRGTFVYPRRSLPSTDKYPDLALEFYCHDQDLVDTYRLTEKGDHIFMCMAITTENQEMPLGMQRIQNVAKRSDSLDCLKDGWIRHQDDKGRSIHLFIQEEGLAICERLAKELDEKKILSEQRDLYIKNALSCN